MPATLVIKLLSVTVIALIYSSTLAAASLASPFIYWDTFKKKIFQKGQVRYKPAATEMDKMLI